MSDLNAAAIEVACEKRWPNIWTGGTDADRDACRADMREMLLNYLVALSAPKPVAGWKWKWQLVPDYPEWDVVGPCICGGWPGGRCLKCPPASVPQPKETGK